jgi:hypothetical protein
MRDDVLSRALSGLRDDARSTRMGEKVGGKPKLILSISMGEPEAADAAEAEPITDSLEGDSMETLAEEEDACPMCGMSGAHEPDCEACEGY